MIENFSQIEIWDKVINWEQDRNFQIILVPEVDFGCWCTSLIIADAPYKYELVCDYVSSRSNQQCILIQQHASFCSLMMAFDEFGNCNLLHKPFYKGDQEMKTAINFFENSHQDIPGFNLIFSGTNDSSNRDTIYTHLTRKFMLNEDQILPILTRSGNLNRESITCCAYIPPDLSADGQTKLIFGARGN